MHYMFNVSSCQWFLSAYLLFEIDSNSNLEDYRHVTLTDCQLDHPFMLPCCQCRAPGFTICDAQRRHNDHSFMQINFEVKLYINLEVMRVATNKIRDA